MIGQIYQLLLAIFKAVPIVKDWFDEFMNYYVQEQIKGMKEENRIAVSEAVRGNTTALERLLGSARAGKASGYEGTQHRDTLPNVPPNPRVQDADQG